MAEVVRDSIPLDDDAAIKSVVEKLRLKPRRAAPWAGASEPLQYWQNYFDLYLTYHIWRDGVENWLMVADGALNRVVITGLEDEREARAVRLERTFHRREGESLDQLVARVVSDTERDARERHRTFLSCLRYVRQYFRWQDGLVVESEGRLLPISKMGLPADDIEVLRQVFSRLREESSRPDDAVKIEDEACPTCGGHERRKRNVVKDLKTARERVKQHSREVADQGFAAWVDHCLQTNSETWSRARNPLYNHYCEWVRKGGYGDNRGEKAAAKVTVLSEVLWGRAMRLKFPDAWRQDKRSILYCVKLRRGA